MRNISILFFCLLTSLVYSNSNALNEKFDLKSEKTGDTYQIVITLPPNYSKTSKKFPVIYYADASLKSGAKMRIIAPKLMREGKIKNAILVGIGHYGSYRMKRRRDFIQAHHKNKKTGKWYSNDPKYGQSLKFYKFLDKELLPKIERKYKASGKNRTFVGHSLSGLFAMYANLQPSKIFKNHIALSPSIWVNYQNLWSFERLYYKKSKTLTAKIFITAGSLEIANLVLYNVNDYVYHLNKRKYKNLTLKKKIYQGATHMSAINGGIRDGLIYALGK